jgi:hypothetical protein
LVVTACRGGNSEPLLLKAMVVFPPRDTIRFELPASARRCSDGRSVLLESAGPEGSGVLVHLRYRDSLTSDSFPVVVPGDTATVPGATVAVRYLIRDTPHGSVLDSGAVVVRRDRRKIGGRIAGSGLENAIRTPARIEYHDVPLLTDTVSCRHSPP